MDVCVTCNRTISKKNWFKDISRKGTISCCEIIVAKCLNKEWNYPAVLQYADEANGPGKKEWPRFRLNIADGE